MERNWRGRGTGRGEGTKRDDADTGGQVGKRSRVGPAANGPASEGPASEGATSAETDAGGGGRGRGLPRLELGSSGNGAGQGWGFSDLIEGAKQVGKTVAKAVETLAKTPVITHETADVAPGAPNTRTTVAVGEMVTFNSDTPGKWKSDLAGPSWPKKSTGDQFVWLAMSKKGSAKITFVPDDKDKLKVDIVITVLEPTLDYKNARATAFPGQAAGVAGVQMDSDVTYGPNTVSFMNTSWWEKPGPATSATGYFQDHVKKRKKRLPYHNPNPAYMPIDATNSGIIDSAGWWDFNGPFSAGSFQWVIPTYYKVGEGSRHHIENVIQKCTIAANGTMTVTKKTATMSRTP